jgi:hypothetical protein
MIQLLVALVSLFLVIGGAAGIHWRCGTGILARRWLPARLSVLGSVWIFVVPSLEPLALAAATATVALARRTRSGALPP